MIVDTGSGGLESRCAGRVDNEGTSRVSPQSMPLRVLVITFKTLYDIRSEVRSRVVTTPPPGSSNRRFMLPFKGKTLAPPPVWLMRQAGRYLPEYRATRADAGGFLEAVLHAEAGDGSDFAADPALRLRRGDPVLGHPGRAGCAGAVGQLPEGEGPKLEPIRSEAELKRLDTAATKEKFSIVAETVQHIRQDLPAETALIGFCGAPWTVATYMVGGEGSSDQAEARLWAYRDPKGFQKLIDILVSVSIDYLSQQVLAGADVIQIFDSWAGSLAEDEFATWAIEPTRTIVSSLRRRHPGLPIIGFPRGAGPHAIRYVAETGVDAIGCDTAMPLADMARLQKTGAVVQGNLDPLLLVAGGERMEARVKATLEALSGGPYIFNLGHGIVPQRRRRTWRAWLRSSAEAEVHRCCSWFRTERGLARLGA